MYAYIDETGNTGANLFDANQPLFATAALLTRSDFDRRFNDDVRAIIKSLDVDELHANHLGLGRIELIARDILKVLRKAGPAFFLARVEKRYVLAAKVVDTLFDSAENRAVAWHVYNTRPLRLLVVFKVASLLDDESARNFWDALMDVNSTRARAEMANFCRTLRGRVGCIPDQRSRELIGEAFDWAADNPEALDFAHQSKTGRRSHLPNMVGFGNLLAGIERQSKIWCCPVDVIKHDSQHEFAQSLRFWHEMYSNARDDVVMLPLGEKMVLRKVFGSRLEISTARQSVGIQIVDVILWLFSRSLRGEQMPSNCQALLDYVYRRAYQEDFSFSGVGARLKEHVEKIERAPLSVEDIERARAFRFKLERRRVAEMQAYASGHMEDGEY